MKIRVVMGYLMMCITLSLSRCCLILLPFIAACEQAFLTVVNGQEPGPPLVIDNFIADERSYFIKLDELSIENAPGATGLPHNGKTIIRNMIIGRGSKYELMDMSLESFTSPSPNPASPGRRQGIYDRECGFSYSLYYQEPASPIEVIAQPHDKPIKRMSEANSYFIMFMRGNLVGGKTPSSLYNITANQIRVIPGRHSDEFGEWMVTPLNKGDEGDSITVTLTKITVGEGTTRRDRRISWSDQSTMLKPGESWSQNFGEDVALADWDERVTFVIDKQTKLPSQISHKLHVRATNGKIYKEATTYDVKTWVSLTKQVNDEVARHVVPIPNGFVVRVIDSNIEMVYVDGEIVDRIDRKALRDRTFVFSGQTGVVRFLVILLFIGVGLLLAYNRFRRRNSRPIS